MQQGSSTEPPPPGRPLLHKRKYHPDSPAGRKGFGRADQYSRCFPGPLHVCTEWKPSPGQVPAEGESGAPAGRMCPPRGLQSARRFAFLCFSLILMLNVAPEHCSWALSSVPEGKWAMAHLTETMCSPEKLHLGTGGSAASHKSSMAGLTVYIK